MIIIGFNINPVLKSHLNKAFPTTTRIFGNKGDIQKNLSEFPRIFSITNENILIYNTSILNLIATMILRMKGNAIIFHLHDPIPHSGILNPIIFIVNFLIVRFSKIVLVFSKKLQKQVSLFYFKKSELITHGNNQFSYSPTKYANESRVCIGFFGRNMPYKNYDIFLKFMRENPEYHYVTVGNGYPICKSSNHENYEGYINDDFYYSLMTDMDYIFFAHSSISFSGVLNDCLNLKKRIIQKTNKTKDLKYPYLIEDYQNLTKDTYYTEITKKGWESYRVELNNLIK